MKRLMKDDLEWEVLGFHLTVRRIVLGAVLICILGLVAFMLVELVQEEGGGPPYNLTSPNETTGRSEADDTSWPLCTVFIFLALVLVAFIALEVRN